MADLMINGSFGANTDAVTGIFASRTEGIKNAKPEFASMLSNINGLAKDSLSKNVKSLTDTKETATAEQSFTTQNFKERVIKDAKPEKLEDKISGESSEVLGKYNDKIKKAVMEEYDISEEELEGAMEILGLEYIDLLIPENLINLSLQVTDAENSMELLANDAFNQLFMNLPNIAKELTQELGITQEMLQTAIADQSFAEMLPNEQLSNMEISEESIMDSQEYVDSTNVQLNNEAINGLATEIENKVIEGIQNGTVEVVQNETEITDNKADDLEANKDAAILVTENISAEVVDEDEKAEGSFGQESKNSKNGSDNNLNTKEHGNISDNNMSTPINYNEFTAEMIATEVTEYTSVETMDIINQVNEFMRMNINGQDVSLEMQLNPANLGKIGLNVSLKEGMITAQLAVENETVKHALESQMVILRENMDAQGLKVDAVEVTIASHEFEQNLEEGQSGHNSENQDRANQQTARRSLRIDDLMISDLTVEEQLNAKIMAENGNSMDITV